MKPIVVLDFETSGMSPDFNDRAIEIGAVKIVDGAIVDEFQSLMNPGVYINGFIQDLTGISNDMLKDAPHNSQVMTQFYEFIQDSHIVAHNLSFDKKFLDAELGLVDLEFTGSAGCSLLLARRILPDSPNHKLGTLVNYCRVPKSGQFHRALDDAKMTGFIWLAMIDKIESSIGKTVSFEMIQKICKTPKKKIPELLASI
ncbi:3'-5' exonuclease [Marinicellulosiphila megalodicopiae]|uniref:3'-5' exonuclease n=1 Tax=Marinicellulosiphila megalodicopiae TaxID=2724896 RepID=UPI003BAFAE4C